MEINVSNSEFFREKARNNKSNLVIMGAGFGLPALTLALSTTPVVAIPMALTGLGITLYQLQQETRNIAKSEVHKEMETKATQTTSISQA